MSSSAIKLEAADAATRDKPEAGNSNILSTLFPFLQRYKWRVVLMLTVLVLAAVASLMLPAGVGRLIDQGILAVAATPGAGLDPAPFVLLAVLAAAVAMLSALRYFLVTSLGERVVADIRTKAYNNLIRLDPVFFDANGTGAILARLNSDATLVQSVVGSSISILMRSIIVLAGASSMMLITSPKLGLGIFLLVPLALWAMASYGRRVRTMSRRTQDLIAAAARLADETINGIETVQSFNLEDYTGRQFGDAIEDSWQAAKSRIRARALLTGTVLLLVLTGVVLLLWWGAADVARGTLSPGELGQFVLYAVMAAGAVSGIGEVWGEVQRACGAATRLVDIINARTAVAAPAEPAQLPELPLTGGVSLSMEKLCFAYPARLEKLVFTGFSLSVRQGQTVAMVGRSGAGKSTLFSLLLMFYRPLEGCIKLAGIDTAQCSPKQVRELIGFVPQNTVLFAGTIMDNIRLGRAGATDQEVIHAAQVAHVAEFAELLPAGYDTFIGERGTRLSAGQRQRIAIARAVLKDPPLLLLDEATASLDAESENYVQDALAAMMRSRTCMVIAHRLATVRQADLIVVIENGRITERGTHQQLIDSSGTYRRFAELQLR